MTIQFHQQTALITGASSGLGAEFARVLAQRGANLVLVARRADRLEKLADQLRREHAVKVTVIPLDLTGPHIGATLYREVQERGITVTTLVNNAGFATYGAFADADPARISTEIGLDVLSLVDITRAFINELVRHGRGALVNVASTASFQPVPNMAVYSASKAFVLNFTEALEFETRASGLRVLALCPGATQTEFFDVVGDDRASVGNRQTPSQVVGTALRALDRPNGPAYVVSGRANKAGAVFARLVPRSVAVSTTARMMKQ